MSGIVITLTMSSKIKFAMRNERGSLFSVRYDAGTKCVWMVRSGERVASATTEGGTGEVLVRSDIDSPLQAMGGYKQ